MSSVQTGQLISLLTNNIVMVVVGGVILIAAWLRWHWLQVWEPPTPIGRRRCRWAYLSFVLTVFTLLGMLASLGMLTLRVMVAFNSLVVGAMGIFLLSVVSLLLALGLWLLDVWSNRTALPRRQTLPSRSMALLPASASISVGPRRRRRRQRR